MITIITRPKGKDSLALYVLAKSAKVVTKDGGKSNGKLNTKIALGITMSSDEWLEFKENLSDFESEKKRLGDKFRFFGDSILPNIWEIKNELAKMIDSGFFDSDMAKEKIRTILHRKEIEQIEQIRKEAEEEIKERNKTTVIAFVEQRIADYKSGKKCHSKKDRPLAENTILSREKWLKLFRKYTEDRRINPKFDDIDGKFIDDFKSFMQNTKTKSGEVKPLRRNTIAFYVSLLKGFLADAYSEGVSKNDIFLRQNISVHREDVDSKALTEEQIGQLLSLDFNNIDSLLALSKANIGKKEDAAFEYPRWLTNDDLRRNYEIARDIFVVGCLTGQRFSDYCRMSKDMYTTTDGYTFICLKQQKTQKIVKVPVDKRVDEILNKYDGKLPSFTEVSLNVKIKKICRLLGWTEKVKVKIWEGLREKDVLTDFCDCISSHTARRTWATNALRRGISLANIQTITGHKTEASLRKYLRMDDEEKAIKAYQEMAKFFPLM